MDVLMEDPLLRMRFQPSRGRETSALRRSRVIAHDEEPAERAAPPQARAGTAAAHQQRAHLRHLRLNGRPRSAHQTWRDVNNVSAPRVRPSWSSVCRFSVSPSGVGTLRVWNRQASDRVQTDEGCTITVLSHVQSVTVAVFSRVIS